MEKTEEKCYCSGYSVIEASVGIPKAKSIAVINNEEMLILLRRLQEFQCSDCGKSSISVSVYNDDGFMYFTYYCNLGNDSLCGECYYFRSFAENSHKLDEFIRLCESHE